MIKLALIALGALGLAACNGSSSPPSPASNPWTIRYSPGMPTAPTANANGTFSFNFPAASGCPVPPPTTVPSNTDGSPCHHVDYVTRTPFPLSTSITIDYTITGDNPVWGFETETGNTAGAPPKITLMIERTGDETLSIMSYRWFAYVAPIALGHFHITVPLTFSDWGDVEGPPPAIMRQAGIRPVSPRSGWARR